MAKVTSWPEILPKIQKKNVLWTQKIHIAFYFSAFAARKGKGGLEARLGRQGKDSKAGKVRQFWKFLPCLPYHDLPYYPYHLYLRFFGTFLHFFGTFFIFLVKYFCFKSHPLASETHLKHPGIIISSISVHRRHTNHFIGKNIGNYRSPSFSEFQKKLSEIIGRRRRPKSGKNACFQAKLSKNWTSSF